MEAERRYTEPMTVDEMQADLAALADAERIRGGEPRHSRGWDEAVAAEEQLRDRIRGWIDPTDR